MQNRIQKNDKNKQNSTNLLEILNNEIIKKTNPSIDFLTGALTVCGILKKMLGDSYTVRKIEYECDKLNKLIESKLESMLLY